MDIFHAFLGSDEQVLVFVHNTSTEDLARKIVNEGFRFLHHLTYSTDVVSPHDLVQIRYFNILRRSYGVYTIVLGIGKELIELYSRSLQGTPYHFSEVLSLHPPAMNDDGDPVYILPAHFVKGFFNQKSGEPVTNPHFDPHRIIPDFDRNLQDMLGRVSP